MTANQCMTGSGCPGSYDGFWLVKKDPLLCSFGVVFTGKVSFLQWRYYLLLYQLIPSCWENFTALFSLYKSLGGDGGCRGADSPQWRQLAPCSQQVSDWWGREGVLKSKNSIVGQKNNVNAKMNRKKRKIDTLDALGEEIITILTTINICLRYA